MTVSDIVILLFAFLMLCFGFVLLFGAPYLPTLSRQVEIAMDFADLKPGQTLIELGCGDGKVLLAAARRGWRAVGYELNPLLVLLCKIRCWRYRELVTVKWGNFWTQQWPAADAIFVFVMQRHMHKLDNKIMLERRRAAPDPAHSGGKAGNGVSPSKPARPLKLVSFAFRVPGKKAIRYKDGVRLYLYE